MAARREKPMRRRTGTIKQRDRFLVYTEGNVSESIYLKGVRRDLGRSGPNIVLGTTYGEPLGLYTHGTPARGTPAGR